MIRDLIAGVPTDVQRADVCIVGAGAAGITLAVELARQGKRVLLLEGGGPDVETESQNPYQSEITGMPHNGIHDGRFRASGGTTTRWGGQILELDEEDFASRPWIAGSGWPIAKQELHPFYERAITLEGLSSATLSDGEIWREIGIKPPAFPDFKMFFSRWCPETNFARLHHETLEKNPLITVWLHANAVGLMSEGSRVTGVVCRTLTGLQQIFHADQFVWCLGGIESSRFFLQPEFEAMPWHRSGLLGRHFQDHIQCSAGSIEPIDKRRFQQAFLNVFSKGYKYRPKMHLSVEQQQKHETLNVAANPIFLSDSDGIDGELKSTAKKLLRGKFAATSRQEVVALIQNAPLLAQMSWSYQVRHRAFAPSDSRILLGVECEQAPDGESSITLSDSKDSLGMVRTRLNWQVCDLEVHSIRSCLEVATASLRGIAKVTPDPTLIADPQEYRRTRCSDSFHHMSGMRMAVSADRGLVDPNLKLFGIDNGYVCSAAVFPTSGFSNPTHTVLALAVRLADHLSTK